MVRMKKYKSVILPLIAFFVLVINFAFDQNKSHRQEIKINNFNAADIRIDTDPKGSAISKNHQICCDNNGNIYVVWEDLRNIYDLGYTSHNREDIYFNYSSNYGRNWQSSDVRLEDDPWPGGDQSRDPQICCDDSGHVYVVWCEFGTGVVFNFSSNYGKSWKITEEPYDSNDITLNTNDTSGSGYYVDYSDPQICCDSYGHVYVVWQDTRNDPDNDRADIYFNYSSDYGATWQSSDIRLNKDPTGLGYCHNPKISCDSSGHVYVVWEDNRNGESDIYFNYSSDYGATWQSSDIRLDSDLPGNSASDRVQICCDNSGHVYVAWDDRRQASPAIYFNYSSDFGANWENEDIFLHGIAYFDQICCDNSGHVYVVGTDLLGARHILFLCSHDYGKTWLDSYWLDHMVPLPEWPQISCSNLGHVYIVWQSQDNYDFIYFNYSKDYGVSWQDPEIKINNSSANSNENWPSPKICQCSPEKNRYFVGVVWEDKRNGNEDIYFNYFSTPLISGSIKTTIGTGIKSANLTFSNGAGSTFTDENGNYSQIVSSAWSGTVTPLKAGYTFLPPNRTYSEVTSDQTSQDYTATLLSYTISGTVTEGGPGLAGVVMIGLPGDPATDSNGDYTATVDYGWSGTVTPTKTGYAFSPSYRTYSNVTSNHTVQDYTASLLTYTLTTQIYPSEGGSVTKDPDKALYIYGENVQITATPNLGYTFSGWTGDVASGHKNDNPLTVMMDSNRTITANFVSPSSPEINIKQDSMDIADGGSFDFGTNKVGTDTNVTFTIKNTGSADLVLSGSPIVSISGADADQFNVQQQPTSPIAPSMSAVFIIRFNPTSDGVKTAWISISNNDTDENPYDITLNGNGTLFNKEDLVGTWDNQGVYFRNSEDGTWIKLASPMILLASGVLKEGCG